MSNPFNTLNPMYTNIRSAYQMLTQARNPMQAFQQLATTNPTLQPVVKMLQQGISPQQIFNNMCQQKGINPTEFLKNITGK